MRLQFLMIGAILFGLVFILGIGVYGESLSTYHINVDTSSTWGKMADNTKQIYDYQTEMRGYIQGGSVSDTNAVDNMIEGGYSAIKDTPYSAIGVAANATETLMRETRMIPAPAINFILVTLSILTTFAIIALIFKFEQ